MQTAGGARPVSRRRLLFILFAVAATVVVADQITKAVVLARLNEGESVSVLGGVLRWTLQRNSGAAFGIFQRVPVLFTVLAIVISIGVVVFSSHVVGSLQALTLGLVLGGALGNLGDRLFRSPGPFRGRVVDFIDVRIWPTFNIADMALVCGAGLLLLASILAERRKGSAGPAGTHGDSTGPAGTHGDSTGPADAHGTGAG